MTPGTTFPDGQEAAGAPRAACSPEETSELYELAAAQCLGPLTPQQTARLEQLVLEHDGLRHRYIVYMQLHAQAEQAFRATSVGAAAEVPPGRTDVLADGTAPVPFVLYGAEVPPGRRDLLPGGVLLAYALATLLLGMGVLAALAWRNSGRNAGAVAQGALAPRMGALATAAAEPPGTIHVATMEVDCRWAHPASAEADMRHGKFELAEGRLEITYQDTDTRVLLVGPATYFVDSSSGGILAEGRLFVYFLEKPNAKKVLDHPLFRVRTPTVIVTDGGGSEFEIDVNKTPSTHVVVLQGKADVQLAGRHATRTLQAHDSLLVRRLPNHGLEIFLNPDKPHRNTMFADQRPKYRPVAGQPRQRNTTIEIEKASHGPFPDS
jgi:hypothetical protein